MSVLDLKQFERNIVVRSVEEKDFDDIITMQQLCFPRMEPWSKEQLRSHVMIFPEGQICVEYEGKVIASSSSLILDFEMYNTSHTWWEVTGGERIANHTPEGDTLYGIEIMVHPEYRGMKLARRLYDARKKLARERNLMRIVVGGRIPGYHEHKKEMTAREYVERVIDKSLFDPVLTSQLANGFVLKRLVEKYNEDDTESAGYATLLEWTNLDYNPDMHKRYLASRSVRICVVQYQMRPITSFEEFAQQCEFFIDVASDYKSDFVLFPEMFTMQLLSFLHGGRPDEEVRRLAEYTPQYLELFTKLAINYNVNIIAGSHFTLENEKLYNISYLFKRNGEIGKQYKLHITPSERHWWGVVPGDSVEVFETDRGPVSLQICYDVEFPEVSRIATQKGALMVFVPFCTDERSAYLRVRYCAQARAVENQVYVAMAGTVGNLPHVQNMDIQYAESGILTPSDLSFSRDGIAAISTPNIETVVIHDVDLELLRRQRKMGSVRNLMDRRTDLFEVSLK
ncbi:MAG: carbon-nitrogen hydrolase [Ectothiorhodospiraceae bacterium]|nr:carbon-nitrogen hydrolase [Ectothiorhodospiraceae bacterium]